MGHENINSKADDRNTLAKMQDKTYCSTQLFGNNSAILIDHRGILYTLRITQLGKLILTK